MGETTRQRIHREFETPNVEWISSDTALRPGSRSYIVDSSDAAVDVTLPDIAESVGNIISFIAPSGATNDVSILINETGSEHADGDLDADDDNVVLFNNGLNWVTLYDGVA